MTVELYAAFVAAVTVLMLIPGPNVALITAQSIAHGPRRGLATVAGTSAAMVLQLGVVGLGMTGALAVAGHWFAILRWAGVAYLVFLGVQTWRSKPASESAARIEGSDRAFRRGVIVSLTNPKILFFYAAFFPQFIAGKDPAGEFWLLAGTFLAIALVIDCGWALLAARLRPLLTRHETLRNRITGAVLIAAGAGLALARGGE
ncbi:MAG TPA: LysE family translocator [Caulobacteraceae bacterium]|nr:LysE family translocator [Caulobacteraceae bacterium]